jgi:hypothetical protein
MASICKVGRDPQITLMDEGIEGLARLGGIADRLLLRQGGCSGCSLQGTCGLVLNQHRTFQNALPYTPRILRGLVDLLPETAVFSTTVCGPDPIPGLVDALELGGHVRVGIEDSPFDADGRPMTNLEQVERIVEVIRDHGCEPATPAQARALLGLPEAVA